MRPTWNDAVKNFLKQTTLHGFKYLCSPFYSVRAGWVAWFIVSACCAAILCTVLWARFLNVNSLLHLLDLRQEEAFWFPAVGVCASPHRLAQLFAKNLSIQEHEHNVHLPTMFSNLVHYKTLSQAETEFLEHVLSAHNLTLRQALVQVTEPCDSTLRACRLRGRVVPCTPLFRKIVTISGVCCVAFAKLLNPDSGSRSDLTTLSPKLDLVLECSGETIPEGCEFFNKFADEDWVYHVPLTNGYSFRAQLSFTAVKETSYGKLVDGDCSSQPDYFRRNCFIKCKQLKCGCSDPLATSREGAMLPPCPVARWNCLRAFKLIDESCDCPPTCRQFFKSMLLENSRLSELGSTLDPLFKHANATSVVLSISVRHTWSKMYGILYTETWWSLLSSLGGVFNMFLGVGLFSALELVFWLAAQLLVTFRRSAEPAPVPVPVSMTVNAVQ